jgi:hypothetical protein
MAERPTPHAIAVCTLIALHSDPSSPLHDIDFNPHENSDAVGKFLEACVVGGVDSLSTTTNAAARGQPATTRIRPSTGTSLVQWMQQLNDHVTSYLDVNEEDDDSEEDSSMTVGDLVFEQLHVASESMDALMDLMDSLRAAISEGLVDAVSAHGVYLRQICLGFEELSFESANILWQALKEELAEVLVVEEEQRNNDNGDTSSNNLSSTASSSSYWPQSTAQTERLLRKACMGLQQGGCNIAIGIEQVKDGSSSYEETELEIRRLLDQNPELPSAYFLRYMNCLQHGERIGALDALHQYFDYAIIQHSTPKDILQFAAILLASTHSAFGDKGLSYLATDEAVRVAQQSKDAACVAFALGWLYYNSSKDGSTTPVGRHYYGSGEEGELLRRCVTRAAQGKLRPLFAGANMSLAQHYLEDEQALPAAAWTRLMDASTDPAMDALVTMDRPTHMNDNTQDAMECLARQRLVAAGIWDSFDLPNMSGLASMVALHCHGNDHLMATEVLTAIQNVARGALYGSQSKTNLLLDDKGMSSTPALASSQERVASHVGKGGASSCIYATALRHLLELKKCYNLGGVTVDDVFLHNACLVLHEWAVRRGDLEDAEALGIVLESYLHPRLANYHQTMVDFFFQKALRLARQRQWDKAREVILNLIEVCKKKGFKTHHVRLLIQLAEIQLESSPHRFIAALSPLLEALSMCERCQMDGLHATSMSILAKIFLRLRNPKRGVAILQATISSLLQQEHVWFQAEALLTLAKCHLQLVSTTSAPGAGNQKSTHPKKTKRMRAAARELKKSQSLFQQCHDLVRLREVLYLQARVYESLGQVAERDAASRQFIQLSHYVQNKKAMTTDTYSGIAPTHTHAASILDSLSDLNKLERLALRSLPIATQ